HLRVRGHHGSLLRAWRRGARSGRWCRTPTAGTLRCATVLLRFRHRSKRGHLRMHFLLTQRRLGRRTAREDSGHPVGRAGTDSTPRRETSARNRLEHERGPEEIAHGLLADGPGQLFEHLERFFLVLEERIALTVCAEPDPLAHVVHLAEMIHPVLVDDLEIDHPLQLAQDRGGQLLLLLLVRLVEDLLDLLLVLAGGRKTVPLVPERDRAKEELAHV